MLLDHLVQSGSFLKIEILPVGEDLAKELLMIFLEENGWAIWMLLITQNILQPLLVSVLLKLRLWEDTWIVISYILDSRILRVHQELSQGLHLHKIPYYILKHGLNSIRNVVNLEYGEEFISGMQ